MTDRYFIKGKLYNIIQNTSAIIKLIKANLIPKSGINNKLPIRAIKYKIVINKNQRCLPITTKAPLVGLLISIINDIKHK